MRGGKENYGGRNYSFDLLVEASYLTVSGMVKVDTVPVEPVAVTVMVYGPDGVAATAVTLLLHATVPDAARSSASAIQKWPYISGTRRRRKPTINASPRPSNVARLPSKPLPPPIELSSAAEPCCVITLTVTVLLIEQPFAVIVVGLKLTDELAGRPDALNVIVPV